MRRLALIAITLATAAALAALALRSSAQASSTARFDVIFDDARGLVGGQLVKIAGAKAGSIENVVVTPDFKARIEATVESRFMPFRENATCTIRPEGLIAENYVDCDPGTANSPPLRASGGHPPTVPVTNTTEPVSLLDLFNIFNLPTRERFAAIIDELGVGTSGAGDAFNDVLRRANPALALARQVISILDRQRSQLATIVDATNTIAAEGASHTASVQNFLDRAAALSTLTAAHRDPLALAVNRLPGLLAATQPALAQLDIIARDGTPLVQQLHASVPALTRVENDLGPFVAAAKPALSQLGTTLRKAVPTIRDTTPVITTLRGYTSRSLPGTQLFAKLASNLQQRGFVENFLSVTYYIGASLARFDATSHLLSILLIGPQNGLCGAYSTKPVAGCSAHYGSSAPYKPAKAIAAAPAHPRASQCSGALSVCARGAPERQRRPPKAVHGPTSATPAPAAAPSAAPSSSTTPSPAPTAGASGAVQQTSSTLQNLVNYLLK
jgi:ABC-type transporter Mla subunit MlaD